MTYHNQGLCHYSLNNYTIALSFFQKALTMYPEYEKARSWTEKVLQELTVQQKGQQQQLTVVVDEVTTTSNSNDSDNDSDNDDNGNGNGNGNGEKAVNTMKEGN